MVLGIFTLLLSLALPAYAGQNAQAWIVLKFILAAGKDAEMAFNNPAAKDITLDECKSALQNAQSYLINAARAQERMLRSAKFTEARCVMSIGDPIKPQ